MRFDTCIDENVSCRSLSLTNYEAVYIVAIEIQKTRDIQTVFDDL